MIDKGDMPAFPRYGEWGTSNDGMTLRQWYAGQAMSGILANSDIETESSVALAEFAFMQADAMLEAEKE